MAPPPRSAIVRTAVSVVASTLLAGCAALDPISDPPVDPEVQPLEVVVNSRSQPDEPCLLNVDQVRAGDHAVTVIGESGYAKVLLVDEDGTVVFRTDNAGQRIETDDDGAITIHGAEGEGEGPVATLEAGTFTVQCRPENGTAGETTLEVLPARADHGSASQEG